jgi:hypothetical protein
MAEELIEIVKNLSTQKFFILLEEGLDGDRLKLINPEGQVVTLVARIFESESSTVSSLKTEGVLTPAQLAALQRYNETFSRLVDSKKAESENKQIDATATRKSSESKKTKTTSSTSRGGIVSQWSSAQLTFYKHKIDPLRPTDQFCITVENEGKYVMTKNEFLSVFNSVVMDPTYRSSGMYKFSETPDFAKAFLKS